MAPSTTTALPVSVLRKSRTGEARLRAHAVWSTSARGPMRVLTAESLSTERGYGAPMADEPLVVWLPGGVRTEIHLTSQDTEGAFCLLVDQLPAGWALPPHTHANEAETIHVLEGEFEVRIGGVTTRVLPGQTAHVPRGVVHSGANVGPGPGRRVVLFSPGGLERFFLSVGAPAPGGRVDLGAVVAAAERHGWEFVRP